MNLCNQTFVLPLVGDGASCTITWLFCELIVKLKFLKAIKNYLIRLCNCPSECEVSAVSSAKGSSLMTIFGPISSLLHGIG